MTIEATSCPRTPSEINAPQASRKLILGALGVVYGDIGTSPLYTVKQCFTEWGGVNEASVYGILSLIAWSLFVVVAVKYVVVIMRADNRGEGGILALTALALRSVAMRGSAGTPRRYMILSAGLVGASLFYGDGIITPAISVLSAVEGLNVITPVFTPYVIPITLFLLFILFLVQRHGTGLVGNFFGPVMVVWFGVLGLLGGLEIMREPDILWALNPVFGLKLLLNQPWHGFVLLGAVVLAVTGAEALYADMGHFGRRPIRVAWFRLVFPALLLNYFGQGALLLRQPAALVNPFYLLAPDWALLPLVILASVATIIASQAVISGAFSMTRQAVQLGYLPRLQIRHTSEGEIGQIYVPRLNLALLAAVIALVLGFRSSDNLGAAYGIAVTGTMAITTGLAYVYTRFVRGWNPALVVLLFGFFFSVDIGFFGANFLKIYEGGWFPLLVALIIHTLMSTWIMGRRMVAEAREGDRLPLSSFIARLTPEKYPCVPGTAVFMTGNLTQVPTALLHNLKHNKVLHERIVLMMIRTEDIPRVQEEQRLEITHLDQNFHTIKVRYGFMEEPNIPRALAQCRTQQFRFNLMETSFFLNREVIVPAKGTKLTRWRKPLFIFMANTMLNATEFFRIPSNRVIELGGQIEV